MDCGGFLLEERGTPTCQVYVIVRWDVWVSIEAKTRDERCILGGDGKFYAAHIGAGSHLQYWRNILWVCIIVK